MKYNKLLVALIGIMFITSASAIEVLDINVEDSDGTQPVVGEQVDINATVDGQGDTTESVRYSIYENDTALKESVLMSFDSGDTKQISYWFEPETFELKNNSQYELSVVGVDNKGTSDELLLKINAEGDLNTTLEEPEEIDQGLIPTLLRQLGLKDGVFGKSPTDLTLGEIFVILMIIGAIIWIFGDY